MKIALKIAFVGTAYAGYQAQKNAPTVQGVLTDVCSRAFGREMNVTGCSRTDGGVHAGMFVVTLEPKEKTEAVWTTVPVSRIHRLLEPLLPDDIAVLGASPVPDDFHPRYSALGKTYHYRIWDHPEGNPFLKGRVCDYRKPVTSEKEEAMRRILPVWIGTHDFSAFMAAGSKITDPVRTVKEASLFRDGDGCLVFSVTADGFLYHMVRIMAGTLLDASEGRTDPERVRNALTSRDRSLSGPTAPPEGLTLWRVDYGKEIMFLAD